MQVDEIRKLFNKNRVEFLRCCRLILSLICDLLYWSKILSHIGLVSATIFVATYFHIDSNVCCVEIFSMVKCVFTLVQDCSKWFSTWVSESAFLQVTENDNTSLKWEAWLLKQNNIKSFSPSCAAQISSNWCNAIFCRM